MYPQSLNISKKHPLRSIRKSRQINIYHFIHRQLTSRVMRFLSPLLYGYNLIKCVSNFSHNLLLIASGQKVHNQLELSPASTLCRMGCNLA